MSDHATELWHECSEDAVRVEGPECNPVPTGVRILLWMSWMWNNIHLRAQDSVFAFLSADFLVLIAICHLAAFGGELLETGKWLGNPHPDVELKGLTPTKYTDCSSIATY